MQEKSFPIRLFDPHDEYFVVQRRDLPHWTQAGAIVFITWRTWDSLPGPVLKRWVQERERWLRTHHIEPENDNWRQRVRDLPNAAQYEFRKLVADRWESALDECHGECVLRRPELAKIVADSLHHFDGDRYILSDFVVMPNHVHLLAAFPTTDAMLTQCDSWKHFTAVQINRSLGHKGRFWQVEDFDHLVRSEDQFLHYRQYIADNPRRADLRAGEFVHYTNPAATRGARGPH